MRKKVIIKDKVLKVDDDILEVVIFICCIFGLFAGVYVLFEYGF